MEKPIVNKTVVLERFDAKGGWTYARVPGIPAEKNAFGWARVRGFIDDYEIKGYHLMPLGNGTLFLPVKAAIRKQIKKEVGDKVKVVLYADNEPVEIPGEFMECLRDEPKALKLFAGLTDSNKKAYVNWIYAAKKEETKARRIAEAINKISQGVKWPT